MRLWRFADPWEDPFASAILVGAWSEVGPDGREHRIPPARLEWEPGSDLIGDFTWAGATDGILSARVAEAFRERFRGFELGPVEMVQNPRLKRPQRLTRRSKPRVWLPYEGPPLFELWVTATVPVDRERSTLQLLELGLAIGQQLYDLTGHERTESRGSYPDPVYRAHLPREPGKGLYVAEAHLRDADLFHVDLLPGRTFCTDAVRELILEHEYTNVGLFEAGEAF